MYGAATLQGADYAGKNLFALLFSCTVQALVGFVATALRGWRVQWRHRSRSARYDELTGYNYQNLTETARALMLDAVFAHGTGNRRVAARWSSGVVLFRAPPRRVQHEI